MAMNAGVLAFLVVWIQTVVIEAAERQDPPIILVLADDRVEVLRNDPLLQSSTTIRTLLEDADFSADEKIEIPLPQVSREQLDRGRSLLAGARAIDLERARIDLGRNNEADERFRSFFRDILPDFEGSRRLDEIFEELARDFPDRRFDVARCFAENGITQTYQVACRFGFEELTAALESYMSHMYGFDRANDGQLETALAAATYPLFAANLLAWAGNLHSYKASSRRLNAIMNGVWSGIPLAGKHRRLSGLTSFITNRSGDVPIYDVTRLLFPKTRLEDNVVVVASTGYSSLRFNFIRAEIPSPDREQIPRLSDEVRANEQVVRSAIDRFISSRMQDVFPRLALSFSWWQDFYRLPDGRPTACEALTCVIFYFNAAHDDLCEGILRDWERKSHEPVRLIYQPEYYY